MVRVPLYSGFRPASEAASRSKRANGRDGGRAERLLRQAVWRLGMRFHKHACDLPGRPDLIFSRARVCVFVDGDFWHGRNWPTLRERLLHRANADYWVPKIARNMERDSEQAHALEALAWTVIRIWETDILSDPQAAASRVWNEINRDFGSGCDHQRAMAQDAGRTE